MNWLREFEFPWPEIVEAAFISIQPLEKRSREFLERFCSGLRPIIKLNMRNQIRKKP
jgi:hypothetical protein